MVPRLQPPLPPTRPGRPLPQLRRARHRQRPHQPTPPTPHNRLTSTPGANIRDHDGARELDDTHRSGLNAFLTAFGLPTYHPRVRVTYTITGSYDVDTDDADAAARDARGYLKPDLSELDNVLDDSDTHSVELDQVDELDT